MVKAALLVEDNVAALEALRRSATITLPDYRYPFAENVTTFVLNSHNQVLLGLTKTGSLWKMPEAPVMRGQDRARAMKGNLRDSIGLDVGSSVNLETRFDDRVFYRVRELREAHETFSGPSSGLARNVDFAVFTGNDGVLNRHFLSVDSGRLQFSRFVWVNPAAIIGDEKFEGHAIHPAHQDLGTQFAHLIVAKRPGGGLSVSKLPIIHSLMHFVPR